MKSSAGILTDDLAFSITSAITMSESIDAAAESAGVSRRSVYGWRQRGKSDLAAGLDTEFSRFAQSMEKAAEAKRYWNRAVRKTIKKMNPSELHALDTGGPLPSGTLDRLVDVYIDVVSGAAP